MLVELTPTQRDLLLRLVDEEIRDLGAEIHHTRTYKDPLKEQRRDIEALRDVLAMAGATAQVAPGVATGLGHSATAANP